MIIRMAAVVMIRPVPGKPERDRIVVAAPAVPGTPVPGEPEHLVVHGEPEQDREHERGHPVGDVPKMVEPQALSAQPHWNAATMTP